MTTAAQRIAQVGQAFTARNLVMFGSLGLAAGAVFAGAALDLPLLAILGGTAAAVPFGVGMSQRPEATPAYSALMNSHPFAGM